MSKQSKVTLIKASPSTGLIGSQSTHAANDEQATGFGGGTGSYINPPFPMTELRKLKTMSTILGQCITAYKRNIVGFGWALQYTEDAGQQDESPEMVTEWNAVRDAIKYFQFEQSFTDLWAQIIEHREETGNAYLEVLRDGRGLPVEGNCLKPEYMYITKQDDKPILVPYERDGRRFNRYKRFRRFAQVINGGTVWFKEFGDPRALNYKTGAYFQEGETFTEDDTATELIHFKLGDGVYGVPRWIGQLIHMYGARKAEELNYRYFYQGRHIPMAIILSNSELSDESRAQLEDYVKDIEGADNAHKFLVIETNTTETVSVVEQSAPKASVELKPLTEILQQDALFLNYDEGSRQKVQSSFGLPDLYVGRTKDFNRATADTARQITEEQVFEPERNSLEWIFNNKILQPYNLRYVEMVFKKPEISDTTDFVALANVLIAGHAITPNDLREKAGQILGRDLEPFDHPQASEPIGLTSSAGGLESLLNLPVATPNAEEVAVTKAEQYSILKDIRDAMEEMVRSVNKG